MGKPKIPKNMSFDPIEMIEKNTEVNRISEENPYGYSRYETQPDGTQKLVKGFTEGNQKIFDAQQQRTMDGTYKNPFDALKGAGGTGILGLMGAMAGKVGKRYGSGGVAEKGGAGSNSIAPPDTLAPSDSGYPANPAMPEDPFAGMSTSTKVREVQERRKLAQEMRRMA